jgi:tetratricopeptide (TPR) repeat protein
MSSSRTWLFRLVTVSMGLVAGFATFTLLRPLHPPPKPLTAPEQRTQDYGRWTLGPCFRVERDQLVRNAPPFRRDGEASFPLAKAANTRRIVVVGESTGEMVERAMSDLVRGAGCTEKIEVLECSTFGAHPLFAARRAKEALAYHPDVIVVAIGHNFRNPRPVFENGEWKRDELGATTPEEIARLATEVYDDILTAAKPQGVQVVALQLASNLLWRPISDAAYLDSPERAQAWAHWARNDLPGAIAALSAGQAKPLQAFERAQFESQSGDWAAARKDFILARDNDTCPMTAPIGGAGCQSRASTLENEAIATTARNEGALLLDVTALFEALSPHGLIGWETIWDHCHPNPAPLKRLAEAILRLTTADTFDHCAATHPNVVSVGPSAPVSAYQRFSGQQPEGIGVVQEPELLTWEAFPDNGPLRRAVERPLQFLLRDSPDEAADVLLRYDTEALTKYDAPTHGRFLAALGQASRDAGRLDLARWCLERSIAVAPAARAEVELALVHVRLGAVAEAKADLEAAHRLAPQDKQVAQIIAALGAPH